MYRRTKVLRHLLCFCVFLSPGFTKYHATSLQNYDSMCLEKSEACNLARTYGPADLSTQADEQVRAVHRHARVLSTVDAGERMVAPCADGCYDTSG